LALCIKIALFQKISMRRVMALMQRKHIDKEKLKICLFAIKFQESQGFVPTESKSCLVYDYQKKFGDIFDKSQETEDEESFVSETGTPVTGTVSSPGWVYRAGSPMKPKMGLGSPVRAASPVRAMSPARSGSPIRAASPVRPCSPVTRPRNMSPGSVLQKAAMFESAAAAASAASPSKDPAELSLTQRMALFEKNKTDAPLLPKVAFSCPLPAKLIPTTSTNYVSRVEEKQGPVTKPVSDNKPVLKPVNKPVFDNKPAPKQGILI